MDEGQVPINFLPLPVEVPIRHRDPEQRWSVAIARGLIIENAPPLRLIRHGDRVVGQYPLGAVVEERFMLLRMVELGWITAVDLATHWGLHRNTLTNWAYRYRWFGLDGLTPGRLPGKQERLAELVRAAARVVQERGPRLSVAALGRALEADGLGRLPRTTLDHLLLMLLSRPEERALLASPASPDNEDDDQPPTAGAAQAVEPEPEPGGGDGKPGADTHQAVALVAAGPVPAVVVAEPPPPTAEDVPLRQAGVALALPEAQALLEPLEPFLEAHWGGRPWLYRPLHMVLAFIFYVLVGYANPEQVKAAPTPDFGPLLGRRRGPACVTLRRRLPPLAACPELVEALQQRLAQGYLRLGWVVPGWWLLDGHFSPYFGQKGWGKGWWPQRRMPQPGYYQEWIHDRRGRPLCMHLTQGFELFADQIPVVADGLRHVLSAAGVDEPLVLVFDRGGYSSEVFRSLNVRGVGWVTWLKGHVALAPEAFTETCPLPAGRPGEPARTAHYACSTHRVQGCHDQVAAVAWHFGDAAHQVALLHNTDRCQPGQWSPPQLIGMLEGRWSQENGFKAMMQHVDLDWTNGYAHEPCAQTPVPNPQVRRLRAKLAERTGQLRRAMNKPTPRRPDAAARHRRRLGTLRGQVTLLERRMAHTPPTVAYGSLGRAPTTQLRPGRGLLFPVLRAAAYHLRLQLHDHIAAVFPDYRERDKVLRVLLQTPGRYTRTADADWLVLQRPHLPRYAAAMVALLHAINANPPHVLGCPGRPLRFALES